MSSPSLSDLSDEFMDKQARTTENGIMTDVKDITVYPFTDDWWVTIDCGEPFEEYVARIPLGEPREEAIQNLNEVSDEIGSLNALDTSFIEIDVSADHDTSGKSPETFLGLEIPVLINGFKGHICEGLRAGEDLVQKNRDVDYIQNKVETEVYLYNSIQMVQGDDRELFIQDVNPKTDSSFCLEVGGLDDEETLSVDVEMPDYEDIHNDDPVTDFINSAGGGDIEDLKGAPVFLYDAGEFESVIGLDQRYERYGVTYRKIEEESEGLLGKFF